MFWSVWAGDRIGFARPGLQVRGVARFRALVVLSSLPLSAVASFGAELVSSAPRPTLQRFRLWESDAQRHGNR